MPMENSILSFSYAVSPTCVETFARKVTVVFMRGIPFLLSHLSTYFPIGHRVERKPLSPLCWVLSFEREH